MELSLVFSFLIASVLLTLMPGPDIILVLTESISKGKKNGIALSTGLCLGVLVHTIAAATGLSLIIQKSEVAFTVLKYLGAGYLFYLAYQSFTEKRKLENDAVVLKESGFTLVKKGFLMNVLNPKVSLFFIAFLPQFISDSDFSITGQMLVLGVIFMVQAFIIFSIVSILSGKLNRYVQDERFWKRTSVIKGVVLGVLGLFLLLGEVK